jgi:multicomponent Na+:H+ antiporter subunit D
MLVAMGIASALCILVGSYPALLYSLLPWENNYVAYDITHTLTQLQLLFFSALAFVWLNQKGLYPPELKSVNLDVEWIFRKALPGIGNGIYRLASSTKRIAVSSSLSLLNAIPVMKRGNDANAATMTLRMAIGFVLLVLMAFVTQFL